MAPSALTTARSPASSQGEGLGGTQSLHTNSLDEALGLPTAASARLALRTQQLIAEESGVTDWVDPFGGSYYVEWLTDRMEEEANRYFDQVDAMGGVVAGIERGFFQREIQEASFKFQRQVEQGERKIVGVNAYKVEGSVSVPPLRITEEAREAQSRRLARLRASRDKKKWEASLDRLKKVAATETGNTMPPILDAVKAKATLGEIVVALQEVFGPYRERAMY